MMQTVCMRPFAPTPQCLPCWFHTCTASRPWCTQAQRLHVHACMTMVQIQRADELLACYKGLLDGYQKKAAHAAELASSAQPVDQLMKELDGLSPVWVGTTRCWQWEVATEGDVEGQQQGQQHSSASSRGGAAGVSSTSLFPRSPVHSAKDLQAMVDRGQLSKLAMVSHASQPWRQAMVHDVLEHLGSRAAKQEAEIAELKRMEAELLRAKAGNKGGDGGPGLHGHPHLQLSSSSAGAPGAGGSTSSATLGHRGAAAWEGAEQEKEEQPGPWGDALEMQVLQHVCDSLLAAVRLGVRNALWAPGLGGESVAGRCLEEWREETLAKEAELRAAAEQVRSACGVLGMSVLRCRRACRQLRGAPGVMEGVIVHL